MLEAYKKQNTPNNSLQHHSKFQKELKPLCKAKFLDLRQQEQSSFFQKIRKMKFS